MNMAVWRWCARERFDAVFVHMNADWVYRLAPCWRWFNLPVLLWYAHGTVSNRLRRAHHHATCVVTSTPEGFRIPSSKVRVIGQGIDTDLFTLPASKPDSATIVAVGRVSRRKSVDLMLETMVWLREHAARIPFKLRIVGPTLTRDDHAYAAELAELVKSKDLANVVTFEGPQPMSALPGIYRTSFLHLNLSQTGSMDKAILESLACGCADADEQRGGGLAPRAIPVAHRARLSRLRGSAGRSARPTSGGTPSRPKNCRQLVVGRHDIDSYVDKVCAILTELAQGTA